MNVLRSKWWLVAFITVPVLYFAAQLLPFYHSGATVLPSLGSLFWFPEVNTQATEFIALFHYYFRVSDLTFALLGTQIIAIFFLRPDFVLMRAFFETIRDGWKRSRPQAFIFKREPVSTFVCVKNRGYFR